MGRSHRSLTESHSSQVFSNRLERQPSLYLNEIWFKVCTALKNASLEKKCSNLKVNIFLPAVGRVCAHCNVSTAIGWIGVTFCTDINDPQRMDPNPFGDLMKCYQKKLNVMLKTSIALSCVSVRSHFNAKLLFNPAGELKQ